MSQTTNELEKNREYMEITKTTVLHNNRKKPSDSIKAYNYQNNVDSFSYKSDSLVSPIQMIEARRLLEFKIATSVALNIHHTLVVK